MAKVKGPLFSISASGSVGSALVFTNARGVKIVKSLVKALDRQTENQLKERSYFSIAVGEWNELPEDDKKAFNVSAKVYKITGYNYFIKLSIHDQILKENWCLYNENLYNKKLYAPNGVS